MAHNPLPTSGRSKKAPFLSDVGPNEGESQEMKMGRGFAGRPGRCLSLRTVYVYVYVYTTKTHTPVDQLLGQGDALAARSCEEGRLIKVTGRVDLEISYGALRRASIKTLTTNRWRSEGRSEWKKRRDGKDQIKDQNPSEGIPTRLAH